MRRARPWAGWRRAWRASSRVRTVRSTRPFLDTGDHVIVINAGKVKITGLKADKKTYYSYSGFPGGIKAEEYKKRFARKPETGGGRRDQGHAAPHQAGTADGLEAEGL